MKIIILLIISFNLLSASKSNFEKDNEVFSVRDLDYVIRCIEGYRWIQYLSTTYGKVGIIYNPEGLPIQMFQKLNAVSAPIECPDTRDNLK